MVEQLVSCMHVLCVCAAHLQATYVHATSWLKAQRVSIKVGLLLRVIPDSLCRNPRCHRAVVNKLVKTFLGQTKPTQGKRLLLEQRQILCRISLGRSRHCPTGIHWGLIVVTHLQVSSCMTLPLPALLIFQFQNSLKPYQDSLDGIMSMAALSIVHMCMLGMHMEG